MEQFKYSQINKYYDRDYFDTPGKKSMYTNTSADIKSEWHRLASCWFNSVVPLKGKKILDAGCGVGAFMLAFQELSADVYGCDVSDFCAQLVSKRHPGKFYHTPLEVMDGVPSSFFDIIYCGDVIEHIPAELTERTFLKLINITKPHGIIYIAIDTTSYKHEGLQDISHINMKSWDLWLLEMTRDVYPWHHEYELETRLVEERAFPGFPYPEWRFVLMRKDLNPL